MKTGSRQTRSGPRLPRDSIPGPPFVPRIEPRLRQILAQIGAPEERPFTPDAFQTQALNLLAQGDVVVSAPTGAGKTYIAVQAMADILARGGRAWYASPLKALSNSKFIEFGRRFGPEMVGLLTGDHKVNPEAPLVVGTTEILRNQLYDAMNRGQSLSVDLVVIDEAHYLGDPDRGVVWEEVLIYLPSRIGLLLLSATIANAREIAGWLAQIRERKTTAVISHERPVPLHPLFLFPDGLLTSLSQGRDLAPSVRHYLDRNRNGPGRGRPIGPAFGRILRGLAEADLLPAIFFLKSRMDCDQALGRCFGQTRRQDPETVERREALLDDFLEKYPFLRSHPHLKYIRGPGVAAHHAGHMPHYKLLVEELMQAGVLSAIFSTSTVAAGVNFPARTVVLCQSDRFNGREFANLTATELLQMTGRAGRRGMDRIGFALAVPGPFQDIRLIHSLFRASPEPVLSRLQINFSMTLNLLLSHEPSQVKTRLERGLAAYQQGRAGASPDLTAIVDELETYLAGRACHGPEHALLLRDRVRRLEGEIERLAQARPGLTRQETLRRALTPGRLFATKNGQIYLALELAERRGHPGLVAAKVHSELGLRKGQPRRKWMPIERVTTILDGRLPLTPDLEPRATLALIHAAAESSFPPLDLDAWARAEKGQDIEALDRRIVTLQAELAQGVCRNCPTRSRCLDDTSGRVGQLFSRLGRSTETNRSAAQVLWTSFLKHFQFLQAEGFVGPDGTLTDDGHWAAQLRLDHPLVVAAGIRARAWPDRDPALLAATLAPFVQDKDLEEESGLKPPPALAGPWLALEAAVAPMIGRLLASGFTAPRMTLRPAAAILAWATRGPWEAAVDLLGRDQGDMAMLVFRVADHLRQMAALKDTHPELARVARRAVDLILKEPVTIEL